MLQRVGRYRVRQQVATGGFATVYLADDPVLDSPVAIKVLADNLAADPDIRLRFLQEARVMRRVRSERLVTVYDIGELDHGQPYLVMEYLSLGTLADRMRRLRDEGWRPDHDDLVAVVEDLASGLAGLHRAGVVHRDIKPSNLLLRPREPDVGRHGRADRLISTTEMLVLADFGLAKVLEAGTRHLTIGGGTRGFMAPEQHRPNASVDGRADLYGASAVLFTVLTDRVPPDLTESPGALEDQLAAAGAANPLAAVVRRGLSRSPDDRYASAEEWRAAVLDALRPPVTVVDAQRQPAMVTGSDTTVPVAEPPAHRDPRHRVAMAALTAFGAVAAAVVAGFAFHIFQDGPAVSVTGPDLIYTGDASAWVAASDRPATFTWTVAPDGAVHTGPQLVYTPTASGSIEIVLVAVGEEGDRVRVATRVEVEERADPLVRIAGPALVTVGHTAALEADVPEGATITWVDWNGERHTGPTLTFRPNSPGLLSVALHATVDGDVREAQRTITVVPP